MPKLRIGIDVGGTNTDCVLLDPSLKSSPSKGIVACAKTLTTADITTGIYTAIKQVIDSSNVELDDVAIVTVGTTHFLNAIIERDVSRLDKVAIIRLSSSFTRSIPPFSDFPKDLKKALYGYHSFVSGGLQIDGSLIGGVKEDEIVKECEIIREKGLNVVVIVGVYSPIDTVYEQEYYVRKIIQRELPGIKVVCSRDVGTVGFLERENSAILNGSILRFSEYVIQSFENALKKLKLKSLLYLTQNDGTMISSDEVKETPIVTFSSGPTNSILGAAYLSHLDTKNKNVIVADIGGTTTDIGVLLPSGFPKQASAYLTVAGVRINYTMPQINTIGLGGGSIIRLENNGTIRIGPDSVGYSLNERSLVFGGDTLTTTDISTVAHGISLENAENVAIDIDISQASKTISKILSKAIDAVKTSQDDVPLLLVGGGSIIVGDQVEGISQIIKPKYYQHANAVGAAVAKVSSTLDIILNTTDSTKIREEIEERKEEAIKSLISNKNALKETCYIVDVSTIPVQYSDQLRIIIKSAGDIDFEKAFANKSNNAGRSEIPEHEFTFGNGVKSSEINSIIENGHIPTLQYKPTVVNGVWEISQTDLKWLSFGCYVLGCAGGGSPQCEYLEVRNLLASGEKIYIKEWESVRDDEIVGWGGIMGSPTVSYERLGGTDTIDALTEILKYVGKDCDAVMGLEIGGANGLQAMLIASSKYHNKPLLDCDWMGRAYPTYYQTTLATHTTGKISPAAISDGIGNSLVLTKATTSANSDILLRAACAEMGARVGYSGRPTEGELVKKYAVKNTYSLAWRIGRQIAYCQENNCTNEVADRIISEVGGVKSAKKLFTGKIISIEQKLYKAHSYGEIVIQAFIDSESETVESEIPYEATGGILRVPFKNEIIYAEHDDLDGNTKALASVPDLISVIDSQSGQAIGVPEFKYGLRVVVIAIASSDLWNDSDASRELGGLDAFDVDVSFEHEAIGSYQEARSVIEEYNRAS